MPRKSRHHIAIALVRIGASPVVIASCDQPRSGRTQVARVDLETAPLVRALPGGDLVDLRTGARVATAYVCARCRRNERAATEFAGLPESKGGA